MNKAQIKAELRRSACEDECPPSDIKHAAFMESWRWRQEYQIYENIDDYRTFYLLIAEAL